MVTAEDVLKASEETARSQMRNFAWNSHENWARIREEARNGPVSLESLPHARGLPAVILGSGPSLDDSYDKIRKFPGVIIAGASQCYNLDANGIEPAYVVAVDPREVVAEHVRGLEWRATLITPVTISPRVLEAWTGPKRYFLTPTNDKHQNDLLALAYPWLRSGFSTKGCTPNAEYQIAVMLGYSPVYSAGVDFCFQGAKTRATICQRVGYGFYDPVEQEAANLDDLPVDEDGNTTTVEMQIYKKLFRELQTQYGVKVEPLK